jgi:hypothetical protein
LGGVIAWNMTGMRVGVGSFIGGLGLAILIIWLVFRVMNRAGIYGWQTGRSVTRQQARRLDSQAKGFGQKNEDVSRRLIPLGIVLVVVGILIAAV